MRVQRKRKNAITRVAIKLTEAISDYLDPRVEWFTEEGQKFPTGDLAGDPNNLTEIVPYYFNDKSYTVKEFQKHKRYHLLLVKINPHAIEWIRKPSKREQMEAVYKSPDRKTLRYIRRPCREAVSYVKGMERSRRFQKATRFIIYNRLPRR